MHDKHVPADMPAHSVTLWRLHPAPATLLVLPLPTTIGRGAGSTLQLFDEDLSRWHATIEARGDAIYVVDQGSRNGVYVDGRRVGVAPINPATLVRLGQMVLWRGPEPTFSLVRDDLIRAASDSSEPLMIVGEPGVGKRWLARRIHARSARPGLLLFVGESELGTVWKAASGGTIAVVDGSDLGRFSGVAAQHEVRLLGISTRRPSSPIATLEVPPLRKRLDELPGLVSSYFTRLAVEHSVDCDFVEALACHPFGLNIVELEALLSSLAELPNPELGIEQVPISVRAQVSRARASIATDLSRERLHDALTRHRGNVRRMGQELGLTRGQLYRLLAGMGLNPDLYRGASSSAEERPRRNEERRTVP